VSTADTSRPHARTASAARCCLFARAGGPGVTGQTVRRRNRPGRRRVVPAEASTGSVASMAVNPISAIPTPTTRTATVGTGDVQQPPEAGCGLGLRGRRNGRTTSRTNATNVPRRSAARGQARERDQQPRSRSGGSPFRSAG
jgi:hypothetical protein